jgi:hypothetical protein
LNHTLVSSGDEFPDEIPFKQKRRHQRRKSSKTKAMDIRRRMVDGTSDESAHELEAANDEDDGAMGDSEESDDGKNRVFAPPGLVKRSKRMKMKSKRRSLTTSQTRQAGLKLSAVGASKIKKPRSILAHSRTRSCEKVRFDLNLNSYAEEAFADAPVDEEFVEDVNLNSTSDDDSAYDKFPLFSESEDDEQIEEMESDLLIQHLEETGEIKEVDGNHDITFNPILPWNDAFLDELNQVRAQRQPRPDLTFANYGLDLWADNPAINAEPSAAEGFEIVASIETVPLLFPPLPVSSTVPRDFETGLQTPNSISMALKNCMCITFALLRPG